MTAFSQPAPAPLPSLHPEPRLPHRAIHRLKIQPSSSGANSAPCRAPQPQGPSPAESLCLQELQGPSHRKEPARSASNTMTSVVFLPPDCAVELQVDGVDLMLEPDPTRVLEVSLPDLTIILVPEGLQASGHLGQPGFLSASPQRDAVLEMLEDDLLVLQPGASCQYILENSYQEDSCDEDADSGSLSLWMDPPAGQTREHFSSNNRMPSPLPEDHIPEPYPSGPSPNAVPSSPRSIRDQDSYLLGPFPSSPLQPLPPSPPGSPQE